MSDSYSGADTPNPSHQPWLGQQLGRRAFLQGTALTLTFSFAEGAAAQLGGDESPSRVVRAALLTDLHYADKAPAGTRYYRDTLEKLGEAARHFQSDPPDLAVELGDLIDSAPSVDVEQGYLRRINELFASIAEQRYYVLGNHCVDMLTKEEFLTTVGQRKSFYSFDRGGVHFVVLDSCFRSDGAPYGRKNSHWQDANIPPVELDWLAADLRTCTANAIVFAHQRLDETKQHSVKNRSVVRRILEESGKVRAVFQGHSHQNDYQEIANIHYCTLAAMVEGSGRESSAYSMVAVDPRGLIRVTGFRRQQSHSWSRG